jgi:uncharacterized protein
VTGALCAAQPTTLQSVEGLDEVLPAMLQWLESAVIGLNLCPFAKAVHVKAQIHWVVSSAQSDEAVQDLVERELVALADTSASVRDTTVLVFPRHFPFFLDLVAFEPATARLIKQGGWRGVFQIATFHPAYEFGDAPCDDLSHFTNRAPYPCLHLLRESSVDRAVQAYPDAHAIYGRNIQTLRTLGLAGWRALIDRQAPR